MQHPKGRIRSVLVAGLLLTSSALAQAPLPWEPDYDVRKNAWLGGEKVTAFARIPGGLVPVPPPPGTPAPDVPVYLVGNIDRPFEENLAVMTPQGPAVVPAHDDVFPEFSDEPFDSFGFWVVPADGAGDDVRIRPMPDNSLVPKPLAHAIRRGNVYLPLNDVSTIEWGLQRALLELIPTGFGGIGWLSHDLYRNAVRVNRYQVVSARTFTASLHDEMDHPVQEFGMSGPAPIGPGRGAGSMILLNNLLLPGFIPSPCAGGGPPGPPAGPPGSGGPPPSGESGFCLTVNHGSGGPDDDPMFQEGGPYPSACQLRYSLPDGDVTAAGNLDLAALELNAVGSLGITGGTGAYRSVGGQVRLQQHPDDQPICYRLVLEIERSQ